MKMALSQEVHIEGSHARTLAERGLVFKLSKSEPLIIFPYVCYRVPIQTVDATHYL